MRLGIGSWSLPWSIGVAGYPQPERPLGAVDLLRKAVEANVAVVQIADNLPLHQLQASELEQLRETACARGLTLEVGTRGGEPENLARYIAIAERIGAKILRTVLSGSMCSLQQLSAAESSIRRVLPELERNGVALAIENNEAFSAAEFAGIVRRIASPYVGVCMDTANSLGRPETLETVVEHLADLALVLHVKEYDIRRVDTRMGFSVVGQPAGEGRVNFDWVFGVLRDRGRTEISVIVEQWPPFLNNIEETVRNEQEWLERSLRFLKSKSSASAAV